jgi:beta-lactamase class A
MKERLLFVVLASILAASCVSDRISTTLPVGPEDLRARLESIIRRSGAEVGLAFKDLETGRTFFINEKSVMHAASTMKVGVMIEVFRQAREGRFALDDPLPVKNEFRSIVDGSPYSLNVSDDSDESVYQAIGGNLTIRQLVFKMITTSSNLATNILIDLIGPANIGQTLESMGIIGLKVLRGVEDGKAYEKGLNNVTDALSMMLALEAIAAGKAGREEDCREMVEVLLQQTFREGIPSGLPTGVRVANKTGQIDRLDHDAAIIYPPSPGRKPFVLVILSRGLDDHKAAAKLIASLAGLTYNFFINFLG